MLKPQKSYIFKDNNKKILIKKILYNVVSWSRKNCF